MAASSQSLVLRRWLERGEPGSTLSDGQELPRTADQIRFVPAWWLLAAFTLLKIWLSGGTLGKLSAAGLVWSVAPRKLKRVAVGLAGVALLMTAGAIAAIVFLVS